MKKIIALLLVMLMIFSLVGCKSKGFADDEEIAIIAGEESQAEISENKDINNQEQNIKEKTEENKEIEKEEQKDTPKEKNEVLDDATDIVKDSTDIPDDVAQTQQSTDSITENNTDLQDKKDDVNQLELELQKNPTCSGKPYAEFCFYSVSDMINTLKTHEYTVKENERKQMEDACASLTEEKDRQDILSKFGTKDDVRFDSFKTDNIKYFYKIKDIPGYTLSNIYLREKDILYRYLPIGKEKMTEEDKIDVYYLRPEDFVTDSYFDDYIEYYKNTTVTEDGFIFKDRYEKQGYSVIMFPIENTIIEIYASGDMANYEALKKLCVAEKVVVE